MGNLEGLPSEPSLLKKINKSGFSYDFLEILSSHRNASAPSLNGITYKVYKTCTKISKFLFKNFQACFKRCEIPIQWQSAQEIYIPKVSSPSETVRLLSNSPLRASVHCLACSERGNSPKV